MRDSSGAGSVIDISGCNALARLMEPLPESVRLLLNCEKTVEPLRNRRFDALAIIDPAYHLMNSTSEEMRRREDILLRDMLASSASTIVVKKSGDIVFKDAWTLDLRPTTTNKHGYTKNQKRRRKRKMETISRKLCELKKRIKVLQEYEMTWRMNWIKAICNTEYEAHCLERQQRYMRDIQYVEAEIYLEEMRLKQYEQIVALKYTEVPVPVQVSLIYEPPKDRYNQLRILLNQIKESEQKMGITTNSNRVCEGNGTIQWVALSKEKPNGSIDNGFYQFCNNITGDMWDSCRLIPLNATHWLKERFPSIPTAQIDHYKVHPNIRNVIMHRLEFARMQGCSAMAFEEITCLKKFLDEDVFVKHNAVAA